MKTIPCFTYRGQTQLDMDTTRSVRNMAQHDEMEIDFEARVCSSCKGEAAALPRSPRNPRSNSESIRTWTEMYA